MCNCIYVGYFFMEDIVMIIDVDFLIGRMVFFRIIYFIWNIFYLFFEF